MKISLPKSPWDETPVSEPKAPVFKKDKTGVCAVPSCNNKLSSKNYSGVCRSHNHSSYCKCPKCRGTL